MQGIRYTEKISPKKIDGNSGSNEKTDIASKNTNHLDAFTMIEKNQAWTLKDMTKV